MIVVSEEEGADGAGGLKVRAAVKCVVLYYNFTTAFDTGAGCKTPPVRKMQLIASSFNQRSGDFDIRIR